jgi:hypothetical protein
LEFKKQRFGLVLAVEPNVVYLLLLVFTGSETNTSKKATPNPGTNKSSGNGKDRPNQTIVSNDDSHTSGNEDLIESIRNQKMKYRKSKKNKTKAMVAIRNIISTNSLFQYDSID